MSLDLPNFLVVDLESAKLTSRAADPAKTPISVMSGWGLRDLTPHIWILDEARFPCTILAENNVREVFERYDGIVTWNGLKFDGPCLRGQLPDAWKVMRKKKHVDLHAIFCLLAAGVTEERLVAGLDENWPRLVPTLREGFLNAGWSLDAVGPPTVGVGKTDGPKGAGAVDAWGLGLYSPVITYNVGDTGLTKGIFVHAWEHGYVISKERGRVNVPRSVLS